MSAITISAGRVSDFDVITCADTVIVQNHQTGELLAKRTVPGLGAFYAKAKAFRLGWARLPDFNVIYLYDKGDDNFGYAVNLEAPDCDEWGYAPFEPTGKEV